MQRDRGAVTVGYGRVVGPAEASQLHVAGSFHKQVRKNPRCIFEHIAELE